MLSALSSLRVGVVHTRQVLARPVLPTQRFCRRDAVGLTIRQRLKQQYAKRNAAFKRHFQNSKQTLKEIHAYLMKVPSTLLQLFNKSRSSKGQIAGAVLGRDCGESKPMKAERGKKSCCRDRRAKRISNKTS